MLKWYNKVDRYLLLNHPFLWASRLQKYILLVLSLFAINILIVNLIPVSFHKFYTPLEQLIFFTVIGALFIFRWLMSQMLLSYRLHRANTTWLFYLKSLSSIYLVFSITFIVQAIPFQIFHSKINKTIIDKNLPKLNISNTSFHLRYRSSDLDSTKTFSPKELKLVLDSFTNFRSSADTLTHSYKVTSNKNLTNKDLALLIINDVRTDVSRYSINEKERSISAWYSNDKSRSKFKGHFKVYYDDFKEFTINPSLHKEKVNVRKIKVLDSLNNLITPIEIYYYKDLYSPKFTYTSADFIQASLILERFFEKENFTKKEKTIKNIIAYCENIEAFDKLETSIPILGITFCFFICFLLFLTLYLGYNTTIFSVFPIGITIIVMSILRVDHYAPILQLSIAIAISLLGFIINLQKKATLFGAVTLITLGCVSFIFSILPLINFEITFEALKFSIKETYLNNMSTIGLTLLTSLYLIPSLFAQQISRYSYKPMSRSYYSNKKFKST